MTTATPKVQRTPMSAATITARAIQRAHDEHVYIRRTARQGVYTTRSKSDPSKVYTLIDADGQQACSCPGFERRASCKHVEGLRSRLAREAVRPSAPAPRRAQVSDLYGE